MYINPRFRIGELKIEKDEWAAKQILESFFPRCLQGDEKLTPEALLLVKRGRAICVMNANFVDTDVPELLAAPTRLVRHFFAEHGIDAFVSNHMPEVMPYYSNFFVYGEAHKKLVGFLQIGDAETVEVFLKHNEYFMSRFAKRFCRELINSDHGAIRKLAEDEIDGFTKKIRPPADGDLYPPDFDNSILAEHDNLYLMLQRTFPGEIEGKLDMIASRVIDDMSIGFSRENAISMEMARQMDEASRVSTRDFTRGGGIRGGGGTSDKGGMIQ